MFKIDLLQGKGVPVKSRPEGIIVVSVTVAVPLMIAIVMISAFLGNKVRVSSKTLELAGLEKNIASLSWATSSKNETNKEKDAITGALNEVSQGLKRHTQWSAILAALAENMPSTLALKKLRATQKFVSKRTHSKSDPHKMENISTPVRTLEINTFGKAMYHSDKAVKNFSKKLRSMEQMKNAGLDDITVSHKYDEIDGEQVISYQINCTFKPKL